MQALLESSLEELQADMQDVQQSIAQLHAHENLLDLAIQMKIAASDSGGSSAKASGATNYSRTGERPALRAAITSVLNEAPRALRMAEIYDELEARNWLPGGSNPKSQLSARLSKMSQKGQLVRRGRSGAWRYTLPTELPIQESRPGRDRVPDR